MNGHSGHNMSHAMNIECDGTMSGAKKGTWKGHIYPGIVFIIWGSWWVYSVLSYLVWSSKASFAGKRFRSRAWYPMPSRWGRLTEPILKLILPVIMVSIELYFDHPGFQYLQCPKGTLYEGRFALTHLNNWQHAATYPPVVLSGLVDLLSTFIPLPQGTGHVFLGAAFAVHSFIMGSHKKDMPQDAMVHWLLFVSMLILLVFVLLELHAPHNPLPALGRGAAAIFQGAWLCQIASVEYEHLPQWSEDYGGGTMIAPVYFVFIGMIVLAAVLALTLAMAVVKSWGLVPLWIIPTEDNYWRESSGPLLPFDTFLSGDRKHHHSWTAVDTTEHLEDGLGSNTEARKVVPAVVSFETDSAQQSGDDSPMTTAHRVAPFQIAQF